MAVWYFAHNTELLMDLDEYMRPARSGGGPYGEMFFRRRLRDAIKSRKLKVSEVWLAPSWNPKHYHAVVRLKLPLPLYERLTWQLKLGSDVYRSTADLMRACRKAKHPSLLILPAPITDFYREPDAVCACTEKHKTEERPACPVWRRVRGMSPWELFGKPVRKPEKHVPLPLGKVPLSAIMEVRL